MAPMARYVAWCIWLVLLHSLALSAPSSARASAAARGIAAGREPAVPGVAEAWLEHSLLTTAKAVVGGGGGAEDPELPGGHHAACGFLVKEKLFAGQTVVVGDVFYPRSGRGRPLLRPLLAESPSWTFFDLAYYGHFVDFNGHVSAMASSHDVGLLYHLQHLDAWVSTANSASPLARRRGAAALGRRPPPGPREPPRRALTSYRCHRLQGMNVVTLLACMGRGPELALVLQALWRLEPRHIPEVAW
jgi:hypothetical protein